MDILEKIFGSAAKVKIMRLFLFNPNTTFDLDRIVKRTKIFPQAARLNLRLLESVKLIKSKSVVREFKKIPKPPKPAKKGGKKGKKGAGKKSMALAKASQNAAKSLKIAPVKFIKKRVPGWTLDESFSYLFPLQSFLINTSPLQDNVIVRKFNRAGKVRLLIVSGVFIHEKESRVDILVVGDGLRRATVDAAVKDMEAELGKELTYSMFETRDFNYRLGMYDKLIRDILDYPHKKLVNKLGV